MRHPPNSDSQPSSQPSHASRSIRTLLLTSLALATLAAVAAAGPGRAEPHGPSRPDPLVSTADPRLAPVDPAAIAAALAGVPAPHGIAPDLLQVLGDRVPGDIDRAGTLDGRAAPDSAAVADERVVIDTFERADWPNQPPEVLLGGTRWVPQTRTDLRRGSGGYLWATSTCQKAAGARSLCAVCGGAGSGQACAAPYPADTVPSILLLLDLTRQQNMDRLDLVMDIWADAPADEGFLVNYVAYDRSGEVSERRTVYSATGRVRDWAPGQRLNLLDLRDPANPAWRGKLAGKVAYLEFLFLSHASAAKGEGIFIDNLALESRPATVPVTPMPSATPSSSGNARYCPAGATCGTLQVEAYVDYQCNGRYQSGLDRRLGGLWVDVVAGSVPLRARLSPSGSAFFFLPIDADVQVTTEIPPAHKMCANSANPVTLHPKDFGSQRRKKLSFRMVEVR
jgi:hypothetical protein